MLLQLYVVILKVSRGIGQVKDLTSGNIYKNFILFAIPIVFANVITQGYSLIDTIIAGKYLGDLGLAATGATTQVTNLLASVFWGINVGYGVYVAKLFGAGDYRKLKNNVCSNAIFLLASTILVSIIALSFKEAIYDLLKIDPVIRCEADKYFVIIIGGAFVTKTQHLGMVILNSLGISSYPFIMSIVLAVLNIIGNVVSITVLGWGVTGVALSTIFSSFVVVVCYFFKIRGCFKELGVLKSPVHLNFSEVKEVFSYSLPASLQQVSIYISGIILAPIINGVGAAATAGFAVAKKIETVNASFYQSSSRTLSNYSAQCIGSKKYKELFKGLKIGAVQNILFFALPMTVCIVFAEPICKSFFPDGFEGEALDYALLFARCYLPFIAFNMGNNYLHAFFRGIGAMNKLVVSTAIGSTAQIIFSLILSGRFGLEGIFMGIAIGWGTEVLYSVFVFITRFRTPEKVSAYQELRR